MKSITKQEIAKKLRDGGHISNETSLYGCYWVDKHDSICIFSEEDEGEDSSINDIFGDISAESFKSITGCDDKMIEFFFGKPVPPLYTINRIYEIVTKDNEKIICRTEEEADFTVARLVFEETVYKICGKVGAPDTEKMKIAEIIRAYKEITGE